MNSPSDDRWQLWIDTGGTFTDCLALSPNKQLTRVKVLSSGRLRAEVSQTPHPLQLALESSTSFPDDFLQGVPVSLISNPSDSRTVISHDAAARLITLDRPFKPPFSRELVEFQFDEEAPIVAARLATRTSPLSPLPEMEMRLATTKGTNALLERKGTKTAFLVTRGFKDLLLIGNQQRPDLFELDIKKPLPLYESVFEIDERLDHEGNITKRLDLQQIDSLIPQLKAISVESVAIAFLHSYRNPEHEHQVRDRLQKAGFKTLSLSHELAPMIKILPRAETAIANAYLAPLMNRYIDRVSVSLHGNTLSLMTSAGGLIPSNAFRPKDSLLSGPAGGVVGASVTGREVGEDRLIAFDMGGTSTDVSRYDQKFDYQFEHRVGSARVMAPALRIETVAAGGGSICGFSAQGLFVGPESAGASPGPACYGANGPLTITDINLLLGRMDPEEFGIPVQIQAAENAFSKIVDTIETHGETLPSHEELLNGFIDIANERMADAIREISLREGYDPAQYAMVAFGGAGGQHACAVAERLGMKRILFPKNAGLLSAHGLRHARQEHFAQIQLLQPLKELETTLPTTITELEEEAVNELHAHGISSTEIEITRRILKLRLQGQEATEEIEYQSNLCIRTVFNRRYEDVFGYQPKGKEIEVVSVHVTAATKIPSIQAEPLGSERIPTQASKHIKPSKSQTQIPLYHRNDLQALSHIIGPAIVQDAYSTVFVDQNWEALVHPCETLILSMIAPSKKLATKQRNQLVEEKLFTHRFENLVAEMGSQLERTAVSTNVKDRLDFSCALLDSSGELIANAPHIPVHLGALGDCTRRIAETINMGPNDIILTNHPGYGGSHLPDVTLISPTYDKERTLIGYVANRAHHAEIGGIRPGSMPPNAKNLEEEGVVIPPVFLFKAGEPQWETVERLLTSAPHPTRAIADNLADLRAQAAANRKGVQSLLALCDEHGTQTVQEHMSRLKKRASTATEAAIESMSPLKNSVTEELDDGTAITVTLTRSDKKLIIDFSGTAATHPKNFHANPAIVSSAIIYVVRLLVNQALPLNEGLLAPIEIRLPRCFLNPEFPVNPRHCPAVVAGNVETSQRVVDTLIRAFKLGACSQGTMNNLIFGNERISYYETIAGGAGAGPGFHGADAVHTHMTNTGITDPEILESRYPVRLHEFRIRSGSGGKGRYRGGCGATREIEFLEAVQLSLLTQHRRVPPYGVNGGECGKTGSQSIRRSDGTEETLPSTASPSLKAGDRLRIETPGGGGWGLSNQSQDSQ